MKQRTFNLIQELKERQEDFEWYPTTDEILKVVAEGITDRIDKYHISILDIGAGDGSALNRLKKYIEIKKRDNERLYDVDRFAIEKSQILISNMNSDIFVLGTDFLQQTLIDKDVDVIFCNPPYSEFEEWIKKILTESNANLNFLVVPKRWKKIKKYKI